MKPKPNLTFNEWFDAGSGPAKPILPYDTYPQPTATFVTFAIGDEFIALPLAALGRASLRPGFTSIALEFGPLAVRIEGRDLDELFESILQGRVRVIRPGEHPHCAIKRIHLAETVSI